MKKLSHVLLTALFVLIFSVNSAFAVTPPWADYSDRIAGVTTAIGFSEIRTHDTGDPMNSGPGVIEITTLAFTLMSDYKIIVKNDVDDNGSAETLIGEHTLSGLVPNDGAGVGALAYIATDTSGMGFSIDASRVVIALVYIPTGTVKHLIAYNTNAMLDGTLSIDIDASTYFVTDIGVSQTIGPTPQVQNMTINTLSACGDINDDANNDGNVLTWHQDRAASVGSINPNCLDVNGLLPVVLTEFTARKVNTGAQITWITESEINASHFEIQRSADGREYAIVGVQNSIGSETPGAYRYEFTDEQPKDGDNYYRLKMVDLDGRYEYSPVRQINFEYFAEVYPNPVTIGQKVTCRFNSEFIQKNYLVELVDMTGKTISTKTVTNQFVTIEFPGTVLGSMFSIALRTQEGHLLATKRIVKIE